MPMEIRSVLENIFEAVINEIGKQWKIRARLLTASKVALQPGKTGPLRARGATIIDDLRHDQYPNIDRAFFIRDMFADAIDIELRDLGDCFVMIDD